MIIKPADDRSSELDALSKIGSRNDLSDRTKKAIEREIILMASGIAGEREAAYEIDFHYKGEKNWAVIHDLRLEHEGRVAQIDHIIINRALTIWVCESKRFGEGMAINEHGEVSGFYRGRPFGVPSPFEQNRKHCLVLQDVFDSKRVELPKRLGFEIKPQIKSLILVSKNARITRPKRKVDGIDDVLKVDQIKARLDDEIDRLNNPLFIAKLVGVGTLQSVAQGLAGLHTPISFDWHKKFGITEMPSHFSSEIELDDDDQDSSPDKVSSSRLARRLKLSTSDFLEKMVQRGYLEVKEGRHYITAKGKSIGGEFRKSRRFGPYFLWPSNLEV